MLSKTIVTLVDAPENEHLCLLSDISASGMRLQSSERLPQGALACVELENHLVLVEIRYSYPRGGTFATGAMKLHTALKLGLPSDLSRREKVQYLTNDYRQSGDYGQDGIAPQGHQHSFDNGNLGPPPHGSIDPHGSIESKAEVPTTHGQFLSHPVDETRSGAAHEPVIVSPPAGTSAEQQGWPSGIAEPLFTPSNDTPGDSKPILSHGAEHSPTTAVSAEARVESTAATVEPVPYKEETRPDAVALSPQNPGPEHPTLHNDVHEPMASPEIAAKPRLSEASERPSSSDLPNGTSSIAQPPLPTGTFADKPLPVNQEDAEPVASPVLQTSERNLAPADTWNAPHPFPRGNEASLQQSTELDSVALPALPAYEAVSAEQSLQRLRKLVEEEVMAKPLRNRKNTKGMAAFAASLALIAAGAIYFGVLQKPTLEAKSAGSTQQNRTEEQDAVRRAAGLDDTSPNDASADSSTMTGSVLNKPQSQNEPSTSRTPDPVPVQQSPGAPNPTQLAANVNSAPKPSSTNAEPVQGPANGETQASSVKGTNSSQAQHAPSTQHVILRASAINWVSICTDGKKPFAKVMYEGDELTITFTERAALRMGNAGAAQLEVNGKLLGPVGPPGGLRIVELTPSGSHVLPTQPGATVDCNVK